MEDKPAPSKKPIWQNCVHCPRLVFDSPAEFEKHVKEKHSFKEGSIILCQYDKTGMCSALQFGDLRKAGFKYHVREHHLLSKEDNKDWSIYSPSQSLAAVLYDPIKGKQSNFFTRTWGDSFIDNAEIFPSPYLPDITLAHFESYCKKITRRYRRHCRLKQNVPNKTNIQIVDNLCDVPEIFYEQTLPLNDPKVFRKVFSGLCDNDGNFIEIRTLQETLSTYLDVIEMKISKQVAQKSDAFFHAMLSHDTIMEQMAKAVSAVRQTRQNITQVKSKLTGSPLTLISLTKINRNMGNVHELLKLMGTVQQTQPLIQLLLSTSDYVAALDLISSTQKVLSSQLSGIQAFRYLSPQLTEMKKLIHKMLSNEFSRFIVTDLNRSLTDLTDMPEKDKIVSIVSGILRLKEFDFIDTLKNEAMACVQATIKQCVIEIVSERDGSMEIVLRGSNADNASLLHNESITFLQKITPSLLILFKRIMTFTQLIIEISQLNDVTSNEDEDAWTQEELLLVENQLKNIIITLSDYSSERCSNLIMTRTDNESIKAGLSQLTVLSKLIDNLCRECEKITGHYSNAINVGLKSYAMKYIRYMHTECRAQLTASLDSERWKTAEVPAELQNAITRISELGEMPSDIVFDKNDNEKPDGKYLIINKEKYAVVGTVQLLVKLLLEYCNAIKQSPDIVQYLVHCMLELVRLFNSRCWQLVLGAGAIQSAGLRTISTSNLALVSRSLQVILWFLPLLRGLLIKQHSNDLSLNGFDNVEGNIVSHKKEIENKICLIVSNMLSSQLTGWDAKPPVPSQTFRNISKHLVKLHEALIDILPSEQIRTIYKRVHDNFKDKLREQLAKMNIVANGSPQHGVVTSELTFYLQTLKTLRVINDNDSEDNILYDIWLT